MIGNSSIPLLCNRRQITRIRISALPPCRSPRSCRLVSDRRFCTHTRITFNLRSILCTGEKKPKKRKRARTQLKNKDLNRNVIDLFVPIIPSDDFIVRARIHLYALVVSYPRTLPYNTYYLFTVVHVYTLLYVHMIVV